MRKGRSVVVIAPHADDETLGCSGTLQKHRQTGDEIHWIIVTHVSEETGFSSEAMIRRNDEIEAVAELYGITSFHQLNFPPARLDQVPMIEIVEQLSRVFKTLSPEIVYLPYRGDIHTDHAVVSDAVLSCTKWFRFPTVNRILAYETLSETDFGINPDNNGFRPNVFVDVTEFMDKKIKIMSVFESETGKYPFPRSTEAIRALAQVRGVASGYSAAEAFMLLKERW